MVQLRGTRRRAICALIVAVTAGAALAGTAGAQPARHATASAGPYKTIVMNNFMGNTWRPVMMRSAQVLADVGPLKGQIDGPKLVVTDNSAAAQNAALNSALLDKPKLVVIDAANATASNQTIQKVCKSGATVVSFDVVVTAPCAWKIAVDFEQMGEVAATWMMKETKGQGPIFLDQGQPGAASVAAFDAGAKKVLAKFPGVKIKTYYGQFSIGGEQSAVSSLVATTPDVKGIIGHAYGWPALEALRKAGKGPVPVTGFSYNQSLLYCIKHKADCLLKSSPTWVSGSAMRLGVDVLNGKIKGSPRTIVLPAPWFYSGPNKPKSSDPAYTIATSALPKVSPAIMLPLSPPWAKLTPKEVLAAPKIG